MRENNSLIMTPLPGYFWKKNFKKIFLFTLLAFVIYSLCCVVFVFVANFENELSIESLKETPPELIVVFTGDKGRIPFAVKMAKEYARPNILITGVQTSNTVHTILEPLKTNNNINEKSFTIDHFARNTVENVITTLRHLRMKKKIKDVLIISHDYHIMRIKLIMNKLKTGQDNFNFHYMGLETDYLKIRNMRILYTEVFKMARTLGFLLLWDPLGS